MPLLPWKKHKVTPLSQIVADLQSPKHASSFLLEPASVVDLFVKNRTRFRIHKSKKPVQFDISHPILVTQRPVVSPPPPPPPETQCFTDLPVVSMEAPSLVPLVIENENDVVVEDDGVAGSGQKVNLVDECESGSGSKKVFGAALFVFVVVVVVLMTSLKELTIGITILALSLVFMENAGNHVVSFFMPRSDANLGTVTCLIDKNCEGSESLNVGGECNSSSLSFEEIEVVENKVEVVGVCCSKETCFRELKIEDKKMEEEDSSVKIVLVDSCEIYSQWNKTKDSRSVKLKSKMVKKLVPKKLRGSKKDKKEKKVKEKNDETISEGYYCIGKEDKSMNFEIEDVGKVEVIEQECIKEEEVDDNGITCFQDSSMERVEEVDVIVEEKRIESVGNLGCTILIPIVLVGLVVGRFPAMILIVTFCFMLRRAKSGVTWNSVLGRISRYI